MLRGSGLMHILFCLPSQAHERKQKAADAEFDRNKRVYTEDEVFEEMRRLYGV